MTSPVAVLSPPAEDVSGQRKAVTRHPSRRGHLLVALGASPLAFLLLCVPIAIVGASFGLRWQGFTGDDSAALGVALLLSLRTATAATFVTALPGTALALWIVRVRHRAVRTALTILASLPLVLPPAAAGLGLLLALGPASAIGKLAASMGIRIGFTGLAVVVAQVFVASPLYLVHAVRAFERAESDLSDMAAMDGTGGFSYLLRVLVPSVLPQLAIGLVMTWARAIGEFGATMIFAGNLPGTTRTLPLELYVAMQSGLGGALGSATVLLAVAAVVIAAVTLFRDPLKPRRS